MAKQAQKSTGPIDAFLAQSSSACASGLSFTVAIPSYQRAQQLYDKTYMHVLKPLGLATYTIVFIQTDEDMVTYSKLFHNTGLRFERGPSGFAEVNYFIEHFFDVGTRVVVMHDDLKGILALKHNDAGKPAFTKLTEEQACRDLFQTAFEHMKKHGLTLGGLNSVKNAHWAKSSPEVSFDLKFIWDPLHFIISSKKTGKCKHFHFDDVERTIEAYKRDGGVLRMNHYAFDTTNEPYNAKAQGGLAGQRTKEGAEKAAAAMEEEYKEYLNKFVKHKSGTFGPNLKRLPFKSEANTIENPLKTTKETQKSPCAPPAKETYYYKGFLDPQQCEELMDCLLEECQPYMVKYGHVYRSTTASRPKCNMAEPIDVNGQLHWPAYKWGQVLDDLPLIQRPPPLVSDIARQLEKHFGHSPGYLNSPLATFYYNGTDQKLVIHQDKAHSYQSTGLIETFAPIYNLSLGDDRCFVITDLDSIGKVQRKDMNIYEDIRMKSGDLVVLSPSMNQNWGHGVPEDSSATELRISLVFRHCTKYLIRQLEDKTWEESKLNKNGQYSKWKALSASKDGEPIDQSERMALRRQQAQRKLEQQAEQRSAKEERSHKKRKTHILNSKNLQSSEPSSSNQPNNDDEDDDDDGATPRTPESNLAAPHAAEDAYFKVEEGEDATPNIPSILHDPERIQPPQTATDHDETSCEDNHDNHDNHDNQDNQDNGGEPTQDDYDALDAIRKKIERLRNKRKSAMRKDSWHPGLSANDPKVLKLDDQIGDEVKKRDELYTRIGRRPSASEHHMDANKTLAKNTAKIERSCSELDKLINERQALGNELKDVFETKSKEMMAVATECAETLTDALAGSSSASSKDKNDIQNIHTTHETGSASTASTELATKVHELSSLRKEIEILKNKKHGILRRSSSSKHKSKDVERLQEIENEISAKTKRRDELYSSVGRVGPQGGQHVQHTHAKREFDKKTMAMRRNVQAISRNNEHCESLAQEMTTVFQDLDNSTMLAKRQRLQ